MTDTASHRSPRSVAQPVASAAGWTDTDIRAVDTARILAADAVQKAGNGHPGTAISLAPVAYLVYHNLLRYDPTDVQWLGRDRFVLSAGHSSLTQYLQLYFSGIGLEMDDIKALRTWGSKTPGHPEVHHTDGVEITTGPLGSGLASAVGMAMAQRRQRGLFDPDAPAGESPFDHHVYVLAGDGCLEEGVASEACSLAGTQQLGNLTLIYDRNYISIEDRTDIAFTEDVAMRFRAYGWDVHEVDWRGGGDPSAYVEDVDALLAAIEAGKKVADKPTIVIVETMMAWPAPKVLDSGKAHGAALGTEVISGLKSLLGFDPDLDFPEEAEVLAHTRGSFAERGAAARAQWDASYEAWRAADPERARLLDRVRAHELPDLDEVLPTWRLKADGAAEGPGTGGAQVQKDDAGRILEADEKGIATRAASGKILTALAPVLPELWGGSADLAESNNTTMEGEPSFIPTEHQTTAFPGHPYGRTLHFGIREHAMGMILNGIALEGLTKPYGGTFLVFSDFMRPAVRLAAIQELPALYVWTHDSVGLGEDGPTHQPIEQLAALRLVPRLDVVRPADANETSAAYARILQRQDGPTGLVLTRQAVPILPVAPETVKQGVARGAYVVADAQGTPDVLLLATGSEVCVALAAREQLAREGVEARVVSMPCLEWFAAQDRAYRDEVLPPSVRARVSVEAAHPGLWREWVGDAGRIVGIDHFGASADGKKLLQEYGITAEHVVSAAKESIEAAAAAGGK